MSRVLAPKPSRTHSKTEVVTKDNVGPEDIPNLAPVETAEPVRETVSYKPRDPSSMEYITL